MRFVTSADQWRIRKWWDQVKDPNMWRIERGYDHDGIHIYIPVTKNTLWITRALSCIRPGFGTIRQPVIRVDKDLCIVRVLFPHYWDNGYVTRRWEVREKNALVEKYLTMLLGNLPRVPQLELNARPMTVRAPTRNHLFSVVRQALKEDINPMRQYHTTSNHSIPGLFDKGRFIDESPTT